MISRADIPKYDDNPVRKTGQLTFLQDTDIGSLGLQPNSGALHEALLTAYYPFQERARSDVLLAKERVPCGVFRSVSAGDSFTMSYIIRIYHAPSPHEALCTMLREQYAALAPRKVLLDRSLDKITRARLDALSQYYAEDSAGGAGFVTNCHPRDGEQLGNITQ